MFIAIQVDLNDPTSIPAALVGISTIVDCATARPEESAQKIDWDGKVALIQSAQVSLPGTVFPPKLAQAARAVLVCLLSCNKLSRLVVACDVPTCVFSHTSLCTFDQ